MTYNPEIPQGPPSPASQAVSVRTNFAAFASVFAANHSALNSSRQGDHEAIILERQTTDPAVTQDLVALYCKNATSAISTEPQLFIRVPKFLPTPLDNVQVNNPPMQLTYHQVNTAGPIYQSFLPGGYVLYFGTVAFSSPTVILSPTPTSILSVIANPNNMTIIGTPIPNSVSVSIVQPNTFTIHSSTAQPTDTFTWMAIARA